LLSEGCDFRQKLPAKNFPPKTEKFAFKLSPKYNFLSLMDLNDIRTTQWLDPLAEVRYYIIKSKTNKSRKLIMQKGCLNTETIIQKNGETIPKERTSA
jgi:hypothetical protein